MSTFTISLVIAKRKQTELEKIMGKLFIHENIPLNLVRSQLFRDFCRVSISRAFSYLLNKSAIFFFNAGHWSLSTEMETKLDIIPLCFRPQLLVLTYPPQRSFVITLSPIYFMKQKLLFKRNLIDAMLSPYPWTFAHLCTEPHPPFICLLENTTLLFF